jgi:Ca-activated chloride channel family protein
VDPLEYQRPTALAGRDELLTVKLRYKHPDGDASRLLSFRVPDALTPPTPDARFAAAVAEIGMLLRDSPHKGGASWDEVLELASASAGDDPYRREFLQLVKQAQSL